MPGITSEQIHATADRLQAEGTKPTLAAVRQALGGGSFSTISEAMKIWREQAQEEKALSLVKVPAALDERMEQLKKAVWEVAQQEADHRLKAERENFVAQIKKMEAERIEFDELFEVQETEAIEKDDQLKRLQQQQGQLNERLAAEKTQHEASKAKVGGITAELEKARTLEKELRARIESLSKQLARAEVFESLFKEEQNKCERLNKELAELKAHPSNNRDH